MSYNSNIYDADYFHVDTEWEGFKPILFSLQYVLDLPRNFSLVDVGSGRGSLVKSAREIGIEAYGYDFSEWCINNALTSTIIYQDILNLTSDIKYDLVMSINTLEHFFQEDISKAIQNLINISNKWVFLLIDHTSKSSRGDFQNRSFSPPKDSKFENLDDFEAKCVEDGHYYFVPHQEWDKIMGQLNGVNIRGDLADEWRKHVPNCFLYDWSVVFILEKIK